MNAHTPGPWRHEGTFVYALTDAERAVNVFSANVQNDNHKARPGECEANARLIAAAPNLLAACEAARSRLVLQLYRADVHRDEPAFLADTDAVNALDAAITRAKGAA